MFQPRSSRESRSGPGCNWGLALCYRKIIETQVWKTDLRKVSLEAGTPLRKLPGERQRRKNRNLLIRLN